MKRLVATYVLLGTLPFLNLATTLLFRPVRPILVLARSITTSPAITQIIIPKLTVDLPVKAAPIIGDTWQTFDDAAGMATGNPANNLIIFAHARPKMFRALGSLDTNDPIYLMQDKTYQEYQVVNKRWVDPNDIKSVMSNTSYPSYPILTLFTCDGYDDESRVVIKAVLKGGEI